MKLSPEQLEKLIHENLRALPARRAPRSLESRVLAAIEARAARPWWKQSFAQWPVAARVVFILFSAGLIKVALMGAVWVMAGFNGTEYANAFASEITLFQRLSAAVGGIGQFFAIVGRAIPSLWLYGGLACLASIYATVFGLGATAYRTLYANR